jgi:hypothetical protein
MDSRRITLDWIMETANLFHVSIDSIDDLPVLITAAETYGQFACADRVNDYRIDMTTFREGEFDLESNVYVGDA